MVAASVPFLMSAARKGSRLGNHFDEAAKLREEKDEKDLLRTVSVENLGANNINTGFFSALPHRLKSIFTKEAPNDAQKITFNDGSIMWLKGGVFHREDGPAYETSSKSEWHQNGQLHRIGGPAIEYKDGGHQEWWVHGRPHRTDGPAKTNGYGDTEYWKNGELISHVQARPSRINGVIKGIKGVGVS